MNALWGFILQYKTQFAIGAAILGVALSIWLWGNSRYESGRTDERTDWLTKIATEPVKRETVTVVEYVPKPTEHLEGLAASLPSEPSSDPCAEYLQEQTTTLKDSGGGVHVVTYKPKQRRFFEDFTPGPQQVTIKTITERQTIPLLVETNFWLTLTPSYTTGSIGVGGLIGYKSIGVGYLKIADADIYQVGIHLAF